MYRQFAKAVEEAEAQSEVAAVLHWRSAMPKDWNAARSYLVARHPDRWAPDRGAKVAQSASLASVSVNIGTNGAQSAPIEPLSVVLERNPALIAPTMELMDRLLPLDDAVEPESGSISPDMAPNAPQPAQSDHFGAESDTIRYLTTGETAQIDAIEGEWRPIERDEEGLR
jgi:hypothetical protein